MAQLEMAGSGQGPGSITHCCVTWTGYLPALCPRFLLYKMGLAPVGFWGGADEFRYRNHLKQ